MCTPPLPLISALDLCMVITIVNVGFVLPCCKGFAFTMILSKFRNNLDQYENVKKF